jgi:phosphate:Na+ symporter
LPGIPVLRTRTARPSRPLPSRLPAISSRKVGPAAPTRRGSAIRRYLADIGNEQALDDEDEGARGQEILSAVINLEHAGDIIANNLPEFAAKRTRHGGGFAAEELDVIAAMHTELVESPRLGLTVFLRGDGALRDARRPVARKRRL